MTKESVRNQPICWCFLGPPPPLAPGGSPARRDRWNERAREKEREREREGESKRERVRGRETERGRGRHTDRESEGGQRERKRENKRKREREREKIIISGPFKINHVLLPQAQDNSRSCCSVCSPKIHTWMTCFAYVTRGPCKHTQKKIKLFVF